MNTATHCNKGVSVSQSLFKSLRESLTDTLCFFCLLSDAETPGLSFFWFIRPKLTQKVDHDVTVTIDLGLLLKGELG